MTDGSALAELVEGGLARCVPQDPSADSIAGAIREAMAAPLSATRADLPSWVACAAETADLYRSVVRPTPGGLR